MIRKIWLPVLFTWMLLIGSAAFAENNAEDFESFLKEQYINQGWTAESTAQWGDAAAAVLCQGEQRMLVVRKGEQLIENASIRMCCSTLMRNLISTS